jgi:hypothetical protein
MSKQFVVLKKRDDYDIDLWQRHVVTIETRWDFLDAQELGEQLGEGQFIYWHADSKYPQVKEMTVVGRTRYEEEAEKEADEDYEVAETRTLTVVEDQ